MIAAKVKQEKGEAMLVIGLSHENLAQLKAGRPLALRPDRYPHMPCDVTGIVFFSSETDTTLVSRLLDSGIDIGRVIDMRQASHPEQTV